MTKYGELPTLGSEGSDFSSLEQRSLGTLLEQSGYEFIAVQVPGETETEAGVFHCHLVLIPVHFWVKRNGFGVGGEEKHH